MVCWWVLVCYSFPKGAVTHLTFQSQGLTLFVYQALNLGSSYIVGKLKVPILVTRWATFTTYTWGWCHHRCCLASLLILLCILSRIPMSIVLGISICQHYEHGFVLLTFDNFTKGSIMWITSQALVILDLGSILIHCHWCIHAHLQINLPFFCSYLCFLLFNYLSFFLAFKEGLIKTKMHSILQQFKTLQQPNNKLLPIMDNILTPKIQMTPAFPQGFCPK
jgi:hypothetical protein